jgi:ribonuclease J
MTSERLIYLPLGGAGEVGMNAYLYGYGPEGRERFVLVDLGVTFPEMEGTPGVDLILPDLTWLIERRDQLDGIIITHAHEDHVGALGHLWGKLRVPVYARNFTARIAKLKFEEHGHPVDQINTVAARPETVQIGPFAVQFVPISHSIPETSVIILDTPGGRVVHAADFKLDQNPIVGEAFDPDLYNAIGDEGVKAMICDSTNVFVTHAGRSESTLGEPITELVRSAKGMVVATTFASNVARLKTLALAAQAAGRSICLLGRAMQRMVRVAQETGVLKGFPQTVSVEEAASIPRGSLMLLVTGSQGERRAASAQLARGKYLGLEMKPGDLFLFSSKTIPGNERGVLRVINAFSEMGVDVVDDSTSKYHVSGHANGPDLEAFHALLRPDMIIPNHGEHRMLRQHAKLASNAGIATEIVTNGMMVDLSGETPRVVEYVEAGRVYVDGAVQIGAMNGVVRDRIRLALNGIAMVNLIMENDQTLGEPWVELMGLPETGRSKSALAEVMEAELAEFTERAGRKVLSNDEKLEEGIRRVIRQVSMEEIGKKPEVIVVISRLA